MVVTSEAAALAEVISERIEATGLSEAEVCRRAGLAPMTLNRKRKGLTPFDAAETAALARVFECRSSDLWIAAEERVA